MLLFGASGAHLRHPLVVKPSRTRSSAQRGYGSRWQAYRARFLQAHPLCVMHLALGITAAASVVDHILPHRGDHKRFWDPKNHQALCSACHSRHKQRQEKSGLLPGCDVCGVPVDKIHHWNNYSR